MERSIQAAIDAAWDNPEGRQPQRELFPDGKPNPEQFIATVARHLKQHQDAFLS